MFTPLYKKLKKNGTTLYVFPSVSEDKNFENQNSNYKMRLSHFVLLNFPQKIGDVMDFENTFNQNATSVPPTNMGDALVESLRNYVANQEAVIRNSKINSNDYYYDPFELTTTTEKIFWKWCKELKLIDFEVADNVNDFDGANSKYDDNGPLNNTSYFREYLWKERSDIIYSLNNGYIGVPADTTPATLPPPNSGKQFATFELTASSNFKVNDYIYVNQPGIDAVGGFGYSTTESLLLIVGLATTNTLNDTIIVEIDETLASLPGNITDYTVQSAYERFVQFISEIDGINNVQLADKAYTEIFAHISHQHGRIPYSLWNVKNDANYKPNTTFPILPSEVQAEIQGGENPNNPILTNPLNFPGDIWGHFDSNLKYVTSSGDINKRDGDYFGVYASTNITPTLKYPDFDSVNLDGLTLNLDINDYTKATSYIYPIETFNEFSATAFNDEAPKDFKFNAILWYYTLEDVSGNNLDSATNLYGIEFLDNPDNDELTNKTQIPKIKKLVSNGYQDGVSFTFSLDTNILIDSDTQVPTFDPEKVYSLFGMELFNEAMMRVAYFNDKLSELVNSNINLNNKVNDALGLIYTQNEVNTVLTRMSQIEDLLQLYATLQIGNSDSIEAYLDTSVNPAVVRLKNIDKRYGSIYQYKTSTMFDDIINTSTLSQVQKISKIIPVINGKDFLTIINNDDTVEPTPPYDTTVQHDKLEIVIDKDLDYRQSLDIIIKPIIADTYTIQQYPINDKKIELYINYTNGNNTTKELIKTLSLPVLKTKNGTNYIDEAHVGLDEIPVWEIRDVFYSKDSANIRKFSFNIEADLINQSDVTLKKFLDVEQRVLINNFLIENDAVAPADNYIDLTDQYKLYADGANPIYRPGQIIDVNIIDSGSGFVDGIYQEVINNITVNIEVLNGNVINIDLLNSNSFDTIDNINDITIATIGGTTGTTPLIIRFTPKAVTQITIKYDINVNTNLVSLFNSYDTKFNINSFPNNVKFNITKLTKTLPQLTLLRKYKLILTRISESDNYLFSNFNKKYDLKIELN